MRRKSSPVTWCPWGRIAGPSGSGKPLQIAVNDVTGHNGRRRSTTAPACRQCVCWRASCMILSTVASMGARNDDASGCTATGSRSPSPVLRSTPTADLRWIGQRMPASPALGHRPCPSSPRSCFRLSAAFTAVRHRSEGVYGSLAGISRMIRFPKCHRKLRRHYHYKRQTYSPLLNSNTR